MSIGFGELCSILSALCRAIGLMFYRQLGATLPPLQLNFLKDLLVLGMLLPAIPMLHGLDVPQFSAWQAFAAFILNETASIFILLLAAVWLKEKLTRQAIVGVGLTLTGVCVMLMVR